MQRVKGAVRKMARVMGLRHRKACTGPLEDLVWVVHVPGVGAPAALAVLLRRQGRQSE